MAETTTTANMGLILPVPGVRSGFNAASDNNTAFGVIDLHDHSSGKGVRITPSGLNINSDISFGSNSALSMKTVTFDNQTNSLSSAFKKCIYAVGGDLYFNNGSGSVIQLTLGGAINVASVQGISGLASPASASFASPEFTFKSAATTYGKIVCADLKIFEATAGITNAITMKSPTGLASSYSLTLPSAPPGSVQYISMDSSGVLSTVTADTIASTMTVAGAESIADTKVWQSWNPTFTVGSGTISQVVINSYYVAIGKICYFHAVYQIQTSIANAIHTMTLPVTAVNRGGTPGLTISYESCGTGIQGGNKMMMVFTTPTTSTTQTTADIQNYDSSTHPTILTGYNISGFYEIA